MAKSAAFLRVTAYMGRPWRWLRLERMVPNPLRDWVYDRIARNRYRLFGRRATCFVPDAELAARFLS